MITKTTIVETSIILTPCANSVIGGQLARECAQSSPDNLMAPLFHYWREMSLISTGSELRFSDTVLSVKLLFARPQVVKPQSDWSGAVMPRVVVPQGALGTGALHRANSSPKKEQKL